MSHSEPAFPRVIIVMLRRPTNDPKESRSDPFWEFGSFGTTGCHGRNLMSPARHAELLGKRFAFAQGGAQGIRLVYVTPPVVPRLVGAADCVEVRWNPPLMPLRYDSSPCLVDNAGHTDVPSLLRHVSSVRRHTWVGKFSSAFRTSRTPLAGEIGAELISVYEDWRAKFPESIAKRYVDALPWMPPAADSNVVRRRKYRRNTRNHSLGHAPISS